MRAAKADRGRAANNSVISPQPSRNTTQLLGGYTHQPQVNQSANVSKKGLNKLDKFGTNSGVHLPNLGKTVSHNMSQNMDDPKMIDIIAKRSF